MSKAAKPKAGSVPEDISEQYDKLLSGFPEVERKGATMPYTSVNGNMFTFINKEGNMGLRLPADLRTEFISKYKTALCVEHGVEMKEYVLVPKKLFTNTKELCPWFAQSLDYVKTLKAKPTKKK